jgi:hypothetical protein
MWRRVPAGEEASSSGGCQHLSQSTCGAVCVRGRRQAAVPDVCPAPHPQQELSAGPQQAPAALQQQAPAALQQQAPAAAPSSCPPPPPSPPAAPQPARTCVVHGKGQLDHMVPETHGLPHVHVLQELPSGPVAGHRVGSEALAGVVHPVAYHLPGPQVEGAALHWIVPEAVVAKGGGVSVSGCIG